jgi:predicted MFS family arabinose efflux permease
MTPDARNLAVAIAGFATFINLYTPQAVLPAIAGSFAAGPAETGLAITASLVAVALVAPFVGSVSDALGRKRLITGACFVLVIPALAIALSPSLTVLVVLRFLQGLLLPFIFTVTVGYIGDECQGAEGVRASASYAMGTIFGGFFGRFSAGIAAGLAGWRVGFAAVGALTLLCAVAVAMLLPRERNFRSVAAGWSIWRMHAGNPALLATCLIGACMLFSMVAAFTYANFLLAAPPFGLGPGALGAVFTVYLLGLVTTALATRLTLRLGRRITLFLAVGLAGAGILLTLIPLLWAVVAGLALLSAGMFVVQSLSLGFIAARIRQAKSTAVGLYVTTFYVGGAVGGVLPAALWHRVGWPGVALLIAIAAGLIALLAGFAWREPAQPAAA